VLKLWHCPLQTATDTRVPLDCNVGPFYPGTLELATASPAAGQAIEVRLNSTTTFAAMQCVSNTGWNVSLQRPNGSVVALQQMQPWTSNGSSYIWNLTISGQMFNTVSYFWHHEQQAFSTWT
jgi:hypothetical protein